MELNIQLLSPSGANVISCVYEQYKKELKIALRRCNVTSTVVSMGRVLELRHQVQTSGRARGRAQTCVELIYSAREKYCCSKAVLKSQMEEVDGKCALLSYYAASSSNSLPTFRDDLSVPSSEAKRGPIGCPERSVRNYLYSA